VNYSLIAHLRLYVGGEGIELHVFLWSDMDLIYLDPHVIVY